MAFEKGQSGNASGRPKGLPNKLTRALRQQIAEGPSPIEFLQRVMAGQPIPCGAGDDAETVTPTMEQMMRAATTLAHKLIPDAKDEPVRFEVGEIANLTDALGAMGRVTQAMSQGELTPNEADAIMAVIGQYAKAYEATELERRIAELETRSAS